jgi:hypothetical protein
MSNLAAIAHDAGRLISFALRPRQQPWTVREYDELLRRYDEDSSLRAVVDGALEGMGLRIVDVSKYGLIVRAEDKSPFRLNADDYKSNMTADERVLHGIIQVSIAAFSFPKAEVLDQDDEVLPATVSAQRLAEYLRKFAEAEAARAGDQPDRAESEERRVWREVLGRALTVQTSAGRESARSLTGMCRYALDYLESQGLMRLLDETKEDGIYQATTAYRIRLKSQGAHELLTQMRERAATGTSTANPTS